MNELDMKERINVLAAIENKRFTLLNGVEIELRPPNQSLFTTLRLKYGKDVTKRLVSLFDDYLNEYEEILSIVWMLIVNKATFKNDINNFKKNLIVNPEDNDTLMINVMVLFTDFFNAIQKLSKLNEDESGTKQATGTQPVKKKTSAKMKRKR